MCLRHQQSKQNSLGALTATVTLILRRRYDALYALDERSEKVNRIHGKCATDFAFSRLEGQCCRRSAAFVVQ